MHEIVSWITSNIVKSEILVLKNKFQRKRLLKLLFKTLIKGDRLLKTRNKWQVVIR